MDENIKQLLGNAFIMGFLVSKPGFNGECSSEIFRHLAPIPEHLKFWDGSKNHLLLPEIIELRDAAIKWLTSK